MVLLCSASDVLFVALLLVLRHQSFQSIRVKLLLRKFVAVLYLFSNGPSHGLSSLQHRCLSLLTTIRGILIQFYIQYGASFVDGGPNNPSQG